MQILVLGNGSREHALLYSLSKDPQVTGLHVAPGNPGMTAIADVHPDTDGNDAAQVVDLAASLSADLVVIGPEAPLVAGVADSLRDAGFAVFGPSEQAAQIEGSKAFAKDVMKAAGVRTARAESVQPGAGSADIDGVLDGFGPTFVVKDDGLAGGKGVVVTQNRHEARNHAVAVLESGHPVLVESFLDGPEISLFCLVDGDTVVPLLPAQDHKRVGEGDTGPNTGGMGAYAPLPWLSVGAVKQIVDEVVQPVASEMVTRGCPFTGLLYAGLAWGEDGPAVVEFNCRFGDPETQAVLELLDTPLAGVLNAVATGHLADLPPLTWKDGYAVTVVLAAQGYPAGPRKGDPISGAEPGSEKNGVRHAGVARLGDRLVSSGGRVLSVVGRGCDLEDARTQVYRTLEGISLPGGHYRRDIAQKAVDGRIGISY
ncbi:phosphoribosylamine--glycine ligase [Corynebacterium kroppenstedtii]|uniref:phosphoribosylamine--glycine ligase n=1 Tax=Corynebacterium sp. PCR 32 TaxID=3351342 RepID=UPI0030A37469